MNASRKSVETSTFSQAQIELATGLSREVLRKWEIRFGFPVPARDSRGRRLYCISDVQRLQLIKQLLHFCHRPRNLVPLSLESLNRLLAAGTVEAIPTANPLSVTLLEKLAGRSFPADLDAYFRSRIQKVGLEVFAVNDLPIFNEAVGNAWANRSIGIHEEHFYTASVCRVIQENVAQVRPSGDARRVLLTTPPGEQHGLGILALHAVLASHGAQCIDLDVQTPAQSVVDAVRKWDVSLVCISVSISFSATTALAYVATLRALLPTACQLWIGGQGAGPIADTVPAGVSVFDSIQAVIDMWASASTSGSAASICRRK